jgi:hypothetical protein
MSFILRLAIVILIFALPVGVLVGLAAKKQKDAGLLRFAVPDWSLLPHMLPVFVIGVILAFRGKLGPVNPLQIVLIIGFFAAAALIAYTTYRLAAWRGSEG